MHAQIYRCDGLMEKMWAGVQYLGRLEEIGHLTFRREHINTSLKKGKHFFKNFA